MLWESKPNSAERAEDYLWNSLIRMILERSRSGTSLAADS